ncbi:hypothetical protein [Hymenobacter arizonensis]|uniref:Uncharacterized protein n=1 Tax=Hymenobacter arizonensis TaxID=1227077 RepID=A0A1I6BL54_HYMAR|nr:hypothetical protein [Hymenobacter arizonensis]SFQ81624.1 hypothetical protein SAMN04515668_4703 [Hymenobacter arizonensis]
MKTWIASVHAVPREGNPDFAGAKGVVVNVLARTPSAAAYRQQVEQAVNEYGLDVVEIEDLEEFAFEESTTEEFERLSALARQVDEFGGIEFDVFYTYDE